MAGYAASIRRRYEVLDRLVATRNETKTTSGDETNPELGWRTDGWSMKGMEAGCAEASFFFFASNVDVRCRVRRRRQQTTNATQTTRLELIAPSRHRLCVGAYGHHDLKSSFQTVSSSAFDSVRGVS